MTLRSWASTNRWLNTLNCTVRWRTSSGVASPVANQRVYGLATTTGWECTTWSTRAWKAARSAAVGRERVSARAMGSPSNGQQFFTYAPSGRKWPTVAGPHEQNVQGYGDFPLPSGPFFQYPFTA